MELCSIHTTTYFHNCNDFFNSFIYGQWFLQRFFQKNLCENLGSVWVSISDKSVTCCLAFKTWQSSNNDWFSIPLNTSAVDQDAKLDAMKWKFDWKLYVYNLPRLRPEICLPGKRNRICWIAFKRESNASYDGGRYDDIKKTCKLLYTCIKSKRRVSRTLIGSLATGISMFVSMPQLCCIVS